MTQTIAYPIEDRLYLNITDRCTLVCAFCPKTLGSLQVHDFNLQLDHRPDFDEIISAIGDPRQYSQVVFCGYGEPTLRLKVLLEIADFIKQKGGSTRINTDGLANLVHKRNVLPEMKDRIDELSISLNAQNEEIYRHHCRPQLDGSYQALLAFIKDAPNYIPKVTITAIDGLAGVDIEQCQAIAKQLGVNFRRRQLDIVG